MIDSKHSMDILNRIQEHFSESLEVLCPASSSWRGEEGRVFLWP
jgi:hypothetical protein